MGALWMCGLVHQHQWLLRKEGVEVGCKWTNNQNFDCGCDRCAILHGRGFVHTSRSTEVTCRNKLRQSFDINKELVLLLLIRLYRGLLD